MTKRRWSWLRLAVLATAGAMVAAACGGAEEAAPAEEAPAPAEEAPAPAEEAALPGEGITIRIAVNPWAGSEANANVAKIILERELGYTVELVEIDEFAQFPALAAGDLDATLEVWPSGHAEDYETYIAGGGGVVDGGKLGVVGNIGWFIPTFLLEEHPELATWEGLKGNEDLFRTAETGDKGQFLAGDPSFVSYDQEIIDNLGLNLQVVFSGSEAALITALDAAFERQEPLLLYFWTPHWIHEKYDLTEVELPAFNDACAEAALAGGEGYACDYADDVLFKAFWEGLEEKAPEAFQFLSNMNYTNEDQNQIAFLITAEGLSAAEAAQRWVDENPDVWQAWLP